MKAVTLLRTKTSLVLSPWQVVLHVAWWGVWNSRDSYRGRERWAGIIYWFKKNSFNCGWDWNMKSWFCYENSVKNCITVLFNVLCILLKGLGPLFSASPYSNYVAPWHYGNKECKQILKKQTNKHFKNYTIH